MFSFDEEVLGIYLIIKNEFIIFNNDRVKLTLSAFLLHQELFKSWLYIILITLCEISE